MANINDVLERLISDPAFRRALSDDPVKALEGYELTEADLEMLASQVSSDSGAAGGLEQRTSKSALAGLFGGGGSGQSDLDFIGRHAEHSDSDSLLEEEIGFAYKTISFDSPADQDDLAAGAEAGDMPIESLSLNHEENKDDATAPFDLSADNDSEGFHGYLKVPDLEGETKQSLDGDSGDLSAGENTEKATFKELTITKKTDNASLDPDDGAAGAGESLAAEGSEDPAANAFLKLGEVAPPQADESEYLEIEMKPVLITSYQTGGGDAPDGAGGLQADGSLATDGIVGSKTSDSHLGGATTEGASEATSSKPKEIVVVGSKPGDDAEDVGDLKGPSGDEGDETKDGLSNTVLVSESPSGSDGDPLVGKITPKTDSDQAEGMSSPYISMASFQNDSQEDPLEMVAGADPGPVPGHEEEMEIQSFSPAMAGDPDQPVVIGSLYNPPDSESEAGLELGAMKAGSTEPDDGGTAPVEAADSDASGESSGAGIRSDGELVQAGETTLKGALVFEAPAEPVIPFEPSQGNTAEPGEIGGDLSDDPTDD